MCVRIIILLVSYSGHILHIPPCSNVFHVLTVPRNSTISDFWSSITMYQQLLVGLAKWLLIVLASRRYCISLFIKYCCRQCGYLARLFEKHACSYRVQ